jgi:hypothetical protein
MAMAKKNDQRRTGSTDTVQHGRDGQHQPHRAHGDGYAFDDQAQPQGDHRHEQQVEYIEVLAAAGEAEYHGEAAEQGQEDRRAPGEVLVAEVADDQVEHHPDGNADAEDQQAEAAHGLEFVLAELGAQGGRGDLLADVGFEGLCT